MTEELNEKWLDAMGLVSRRKEYLLANNLDASDRRVREVTNAIDGLMYWVRLRSNDLITDDTIQSLIDEVNEKFKNI